MDWGADGRHLFHQHSDFVAHAVRGVVDGFDEDILPCPQPKLTKQLVRLVAGLKPVEQSEAFTLEDTDRLSCLGHNQRDLSSARHTQQLELFGCKAHA